MADVFSQQMVGSHSSAFTSEMFRLCIRTFVGHSLSNRTETKEDWQQLANEMTNDDCWKEIMFTLRSCQSHGGLYALRQTGHIESCNYITFHRALQQMVSKPLGGPDVPQRRYHELLADPKLLDSKGKKWQQAQSIIDHWIALFHGGM